jgi:hypothetical protein
MAPEQGILKMIKTLLTAMTFTILLSACSNENDYFTEDEEAWKKASEMPLIKRGPEWEAYLKGGAEWEAYKQKRDESK